jgi:SAM-dependent methyltransferase
MRLDPAKIRFGPAESRPKVHRGHSAAERVHPSIFRYDYLALRRLSDDMQDLIASLPGGNGGRALDIGSSESPYREWVARRGFRLETLDIDGESQPDHVGTAEETGLADETFDLVLCTQVLEHVPHPWMALAEIRRILRPGGHLIASVPHVWFYHPHPGDFWRFTQEGVLQACDDACLELIELRAQGGTALTMVQCANFMLYGVLGRLGAPIYALANITGNLGDRLVRDVLFAHNFAWIARKGSP